MPPELLLSEALQVAAYGADQQLGQPHFCTATPTTTGKNDSDDSDSLLYLTRDTAIDFWQRQVLENPHGLVIGGAGVQHDQLVTLAEAHFGHLQQQQQQAGDNNNNGTTTGARQQQQQQQRIVTIPSVYRGGECRVQLPLPESSDEIESSNNGMVSVVSAEQRLTRVAIALEVGGWYSDDLVATCVLQTLLGGGSRPVDPARACTAACTDRC